MDNTLSNLFNNNRLDVPIWFLRQSGRHIPEYFELRNKNTLSKKFNKKNFKLFIAFYVNKVRLIDNI